MYSKDFFHCITEKKDFNDFFCDLLHWIEKLLLLRQAQQGYHLRRLELQQPVGSRLGGQEPQHLQPRWGYHQVG